MVTIHHGLTVRIVSGLIDGVPAKALDSTHTTEDTEMVPRTMTMVHARLVPAGPLETGISTVFVEADPSGHSVCRDSCCSSRDYLNNLTCCGCSHRVHHVCGSPSLGVVCDHCGCTSTSTTSTAVLLTNWREAKHVSQTSGL